MIPRVPQTQTCAVVWEGRVSPKNTSGLLQTSAAIVLSMTSGTIVLSVVTWLLHHSSGVGVAVTLSHSLPLSLPSSNAKKSSKSSSFYNPILRRNVEFAIHINEKIQVHNYKPNNHPPTDHYNSQRSGRIKVRSKG